VRLLAKCIYRCLRCIARSLFAIWPPSRLHRALITTVRDEFRSCESSSLTAHPEWIKNRKRLRAAVLHKDPRAFLTWDVVNETMFIPPYAPFVRHELRALRNRDWDSWRRAIAERAAGLPFPSVFYPFSSSNAIHHAYHLHCFESETKTCIRDYRTIVEFGGGYGSLQRIVHNLGFTGNYVGYDLPELQALQRYYLGSIGVHRAVTEQREPPRLFIATWSLSESPVELRERIADEVSDFDAFLIAYQKHFGGIDNDAYFAAWRRRFPSIRWRLIKIEHLPHDYYLFGVRE